MLFRPEFLQPKALARPSDELSLLQSLEEFPTHLQFDGTARRDIAYVFEKMHADSKMSASVPLLNALLRFELQAFLARVRLLHSASTIVPQTPRRVVERFRRFRLLLEAEFPRWHGVKDYAGALALSEKSLTRASLEVAGLSAKQYVMRRIALEAKRLLAHSELPVATIADRLGFDEATNFVKFFKRECGMAPKSFRQLHT